MLFVYSRAGDAPQTLVDLIRPDGDKDKSPSSSQGSPDKSPATGRKSTNPEEETTPSASPEVAALTGI